MNLNCKTDEELAMLAQGFPSNTEAESILVKRYWDKCGIIARQFKMTGVEFEDREATCLGALVKAVRKYVPGKGTKFITFAKMIIGRALIELWRETHQKGEVPQSALRSIDEAVSVDGDELSLVDILADDANTHETVTARIEADEASRLIASQQFNRFMAILGTDDVGVYRTVALRLVDSLLQFVACQVANGDRNMKDYADLKELLGKVESFQPGLFSMAPEAGTPEQLTLARDVFESYSSVQFSILCDLAEGYDYQEIADRQKVTFAVVSSMIQAVKEAAEVMEVTRAAA